MSIKPVDFQVSIPRSADLAKTNNSASGRGDEIRHVFSQQMQKQVEIENTQVLGTGKTEHNKVDKDGKNDSGGAAKDEKEKKKKNKDEKPSAKSRESMYDISV